MSCIIKVNGGNIKKGSRKRKLVMKLFFLRAISNEYIIFRRRYIEMQKEEYCKPEIKSEVIEIGVCGYAPGPIDQLQPMFGLCCT